MSTGKGSSSSSVREGSAKSTVTDQISQAIQSTSNLVHLMRQSSPSEAHLAKLPRNLIAKTDTIKNTGQVLEHLPSVISSLDAHMENGLRSVPCLETVVQLLADMENGQLNALSEAQSHTLSKGGSIRTNRSPDPNKSIVEL